MKTRICDGVAYCQEGPFTRIEFDFIVFMSTYCYGNYALFNVCRRRKKNTLNEVMCQWKAMNLQ
jgi:hypothetical protein